MENSENLIPMISGILEAVPQPETQPTLTYLDRSTSYTLQLEKLNEKLFDDQLSVSIRLGLHSNFISELYPERAQLEAWKSIHLHERLFDVQFGETVLLQHNATNGNKISANENDNDHAYSVNVDWNRNKELPLKIRFNCVSSQFRNSPVFVLVVKVVSKTLNYEIFHSFCQIKLFWPDWTAEENRMRGIEDDTESQSSDFELNIIGQTRLIPYDPIKLMRQQQYRSNDNVNERLYGYLQEPLENFETIANNSANQNYLQYSFAGPEDAYLEESRDNSQSVKGIFIQPEVSFGIKIKPDARMKNKFDAQQFSVIRFELQKSNQAFTSKDRSEWLGQNPGKLMIEPDFTASQFTSNLLDMRTISVNQIEMILKSNFESEEIAAFKVNCLSEDFAANGQEMSFKLNIKSVQPATRTNLGATSFAVVTSNEHSSQQMIHKWLNQTSVDSNNISFSKSTIQLFGLMAILSLFLLFYIPFYNSTNEISNVDQIVQAKLEAELKKLSQVREIELNQNKLTDSQPNVVTQSEIDSKAAKFDGANDDLSKNDSLLIILSAPTTAGISSKHPTLTNLDRSTWYNLRLEKLDKALYDDKLLVSFQIKLNIDTQNLENDQYLLKLWKSHHRTERLFDLTYMNTDRLNQIVLNQDSQLVDSASFYWNSFHVTNLELRFNFVHSQFPFKRSLTAPNDGTFFLHAKVSSLTKSSNTVIDDSFCQVKLFWPNGAAISNHKANHLVLQAQPNSDLVPSQPSTKFTLSKDKLAIQSQNNFVKDDTLIGKLSILTESNLTNIARNTQNYLHYILDHPKMSFVDVTTLNGGQFKGFFLEEYRVFAVKLLTNSKRSSEMVNSIVRTRFELNPTSRPFTELELINWSANKQRPMFEIEYLKSQMSDIVYDIRLIDVNCIEIIWLPKLDQSLQDLVIAFILNTESSDRPHLFQIQSFIIINETFISALDFASSQIVLTESGQAQVSKENWLQQNVDKSFQSAETLVQIMNDPIQEQTKFLFNFKLPTLSLPSLSLPNATNVFIWLVQWAVRSILFLAILSYFKNIYQGKIGSYSVIQNLAGAVTVAIVSILLYATFIF